MCFWWWYIIVFVDDFYELFVVKDVISYGDEYVYKYVKECKIINVGGLVMIFLEDNWECSEGQVQCIVDDGYVNRGEENNGFFE